MFPPRPPLIAWPDVVLWVFVASAVCAGNLAARALWWQILSWLVP